MNQTRENMKIGLIVFTISMIGLFATFGLWPKPQPKEVIIVTQIVEVTREIVVTTTPLAPPELGYIPTKISLIMTQANLATMTPAFLVSSWNAYRWAIPGYLCESLEKPYGIGHFVPGVSGGIKPGDEWLVGIEIYSDVKPGVSCVDIQEVWLYDKEGNKQIYNIVIEIQIQ